MTLHLSTSNAATLSLSTYGSVTNQLANANGYATSGKTFNNTWTAGSSATITGIKFAVIWCSGASAGAKKLLAYAALSAGAFNITAGNRLTISPTATGFFDMA